MPVYQSSSEYAGLLGAFSFASWNDEPLWTAGRTGEDITKPAHIEGSPPSDQPDADPGRFITRWAFIADVFEGPDHPGQEVIAAHQLNPWSATALRVYGAEGEVLYEAWHDGQILESIYDADEGLIICAGVNSERRFSDLTGCEHDPLVVFALKPRLGRTEQLLTREACPEGFRPVWYSVIGPPEVACELYIHNLEPLSQTTASYSDLYLVRLRNIDRAGSAAFSFGLLLSASGSIVNYRIDPDAIPLLDIHPSVYNLFTLAPNR